MVDIKLGYNPKLQYNWEVLPNTYKEKTFNKKLVVTINQRLWGKVQNIMKFQRKGYQIPVLIDGDTRTGKSTLGKIIAYLLNPNLTIKNFVADLESTPDKIDKAKVEDVLLFDETSLIANSKEGMKKQNVQLEKIIDVVGVKRLCLIFIMPSFFKISHSIAVQHSKFLLHVYTDKNLNRGRFMYFSTKRKKFLYIQGKKNSGSYKTPKSNFNGLFTDFKLPFEDEYEKLKAQSLRSALNPNEKKGKTLTEKDYKKKFMIEFKKNNPDVTDKNIWLGFGSSKTEYYRHKRGDNGVRSS